jgi:hypothetical protein
LLVQNKVGGAKGSLGSLYGLANGI